MDTPYGPDKSFWAKIAIGNLWDMIELFNPILTGPSTSIILTGGGGLAGPTLSLKNGLLQPPGIDLLLIYKSFQPIWAFKIPTFAILAKILMGRCGPS